VHTKYWASTGFVDTEDTLCVRLSDQCVWYCGHVGVTLARQNQSVFDGRRAEDIVCRCRLGDLLTAQVIFHVLHVGVVGQYCDQ